MSVINTNTISLNAQRNLSTNSASLATSIQRLSSGQRINSAKDDAAGLAISERFTTQIRGMNQAARNANDGISLAQTAEGALGEIGNNLQRIRELAVQSRNATNSESDRAALNSEVEQLKKEIQRVSEQTEFNGTKLLDGNFTAKSFQVGANQGQTIDIAQIVNAGIGSLGSWTSVATPASVAGAAPEGTNNPGSGFLDLSAFPVVEDEDIAEFTLRIGSREVPVGPVEFDTDEATTREALATAIATAVGTNAQAGPTATAAGTTVTFTNTGAGSFTVAGGGLTGTITAQTTSYDAIAADSFSINGIDIGAVAAATSSGQRGTALANAINAKTTETGVTASVVDGALSLKSGSADIVIAGNVTGTGLTAGRSGELTGSTAYAVGGAKTGFADLDISSVEGADNAIRAMDEALNSVNSGRADLGAIQNRFSSVVANLQTSSENLSASRSRIVDTDFAKETAELSRSQVLQQAGTAMLAQANQLPNNVLSLLR